MTRHRRAQTSLLEGVVERSTNVRMGQKATCAPQKVMSALPPKADIRQSKTNVRFGSKADIRILELAASVHRDLRTGHTI